MTNVEFIMRYATPSITDVLKDSFNLYRGYGDNDLSKRDAKYVIKHNLTSILLSLAMHFCYRNSADVLDACKSIAGTIDADDGECNVLIVICADSVLYGDIHESAEHRGNITIDRSIYPEFAKTLSLEDYTALYQVRAYHEYNTGVAVEIRKVELTPFAV